MLPPGLYNLAETQPVDFDDWREQNGDPYGPAVGIANDLFTGIALTAGTPIRGPFNFGEVLSQAENPPNRSPQSPGDPTKREFLSSTEDPGSAGAARRQAAFTLPPEEVQPSPGIAAPVAALPLQPRFAVATGIPTQPTYVATGSGPGITPMVRVFDYATGIEKFRLQAYESGYTGGVRTAVGDVNGDGIADIITATGIGGGPRIRVFDGRDGSSVFDFFAFESTYTGGVSLAVGDVDGDGNADIIAGTDEGGGPRVRVFSGSTGLTLQDFFAFDSNQRGGVRVAAADFNGDGRDDIVAVSGAGVPTQVRVFDAATQTVLTQFQPYGNGFTGGSTVAAGDFNGDGTPDIITGADAGGGPHVQVFSGLTGVSVASFFAVDPSFTGGVRVAAADLNGDGRVELITGAGMGGAARVSIYSGAGISLVDDFFAYDIDHMGGVYVGAGTGRGVTNPPPNSTPAALGQLGNPGSLPPL